MANWKIICDCGKEVLNQHIMDEYSKERLTLKNVEDFKCSDCILKEERERVK